MEVKIKTIPHQNQRYPSVGDYQRQPDGSWYISVSDTGDEKQNFLIALHEFIELYLTQFAGITEESITDFDLFFEQRIKQGFANQDDEPGFASTSPYKKQHTIATAIEMMVAVELGIDWKEYEKNLQSM